MEVLRKYIDADSLMSVMKLPETFKNRRLEVIILPADANRMTKEKGSQKVVDQWLRKRYVKIPEP